MSRYDPPAPRAAGQAHSADGTRIAYEEHGPAGAPTVVLAHGWTCRTAFWAPVIRELVPEFRVVAYDQRGHGGSDTPASADRYGTEALADDLQAVLEAVLPDGDQAVLVGHSMGGMTIMAAADRTAVRARTAAVLLASTGSGRLVAETRVLPPRVSRPRVRRALHRALLVSSAPLGPRGRVLAAALKYGVLSPGATPEQVAVTVRIVHSCARRPRAAWGRVLAGLNLDAGVAALAAPTAVLVGTADKLTPPSHAHGIAARLPHCTGVTELRGLGHMTPLEDPDTVAAVVRDLARTYLTPRHLGAGKPEEPEESEESRESTEGETA